MLMSQQNGEVAENPEVRIHIDERLAADPVGSGAVQGKTSTAPVEAGSTLGENGRTPSPGETAPMSCVHLFVKTYEKLQGLPLSSALPVSTSGVPSIGTAAAGALRSPLFSPKGSQQLGGAGAAVLSPRSADGAVSEWELSLRHPSTGKNPLVSLFKTPKNTLIQIIRAGMAKSQLTWLQTLLLGVMAGAYISMGGALTVTIAGMLGNTDVAYRSAVQRMAVAGLFPVGLFLIIIAGGELFTGNVMAMGAAFLAKKVSWQGVLRNWVLSYIGNYIGCLAFAFLFICSTTTSLETATPNATFISSLLTAKTHLGWGSVLLRAVACNWLVCLAVWMAACAEDFSGKLIAVWWPIMTFVGIGFEHSIANMFYLMLGLMEGGAGGTVNFGETLAWNLIPVTIGNIIGGLFFIGMQLLLFGPYFSAEFLEVKSGQKKATSATAAAVPATDNSNTAAAAVVRSAAIIPVALVDGIRSPLPLSMDNVNANPGNSTSVK